LSRPLSVTPPDWTAYPTVFSYGTNGSSEVKIDGTSSYYAAGTLNAKFTTGPDGNVSTVYTDKIGRQLLTKMSNPSGSQTTETNYIYDDRNRQVMVLPPGTSTSTSNLIYKYEYTGFDQVSKKWIPDQIGFTEFRYNDRRLLAATQDPNLRAQSKWTAISYDDYGRSEESGFVSGTPNLNTPSFSQLLTEMEYGIAGIEKGKVTKERTRALNKSSVGWLETNFTYDVHGRVATTSGNNFLLPNDLLAEQVTMGYDFADNPVTMTRVHKYSGGTRTIAERNTYDDWGRPVDAYLAMNGGAEKHLSESHYTIKDQILEMNLGYVGGSQGWLQSVDYSYNTQGWLTGINDMSPLGGTIAAMTICADGGSGGNEDGGDGGAGGEDPPGGALWSGGSAQTKALKQVTNPDSYDLFQLSLRYDNPMTAMGSDAPARGNGNISQAIWQTRSREKQTYGYEYDYLSRLTDGNHRVIDAAGAVTAESYYNTSYTYDERGNIETLYRRGIEDDGTCWDEVTIDQLTYDYESNSNRLEEVRDAFNKPQGFNENGAALNVVYNYDDNGNMVYDPYKDMHLYYNHLNLPDSIVLPGLTIVNYYSASGAKLQEKEIKTAGTTTRTYLGGLEYIDGDLDAYYHPSARVYYGGTSSAEYQYSIQDHLGNTRVMFADKDSDGIIEETAGEILQEHHYYPFGLEMDGAWNNYGLDDSRYRYNGKELVEDIGLYDYGARWYDPAVARWNAVDPLADQFAAHSPYNYVMGNPISLVDPDGRAPDWIKTTNDDGSVTYTAEQGDSATSLEEQHGVSFEVGDAVIQQIFGPNVDSDKPEGRSNIHPGDQITFAAIENTSSDTEGGESSGGNWLSGIGDWLSSLMPGPATSSSEGSQQQHTGDGFTIYAVGSRSGWSINAPASDANGTHTAIDITSMFPSGGGLPSFVNPIKGINKFKGEIGNAIDRARSQGANNRVKVCTFCGDTLPIDAPQRHHTGFDTINRQ